MKIFYTIINDKDLLETKTTISNNIKNISEKLFTFHTSYILNPLNWITGLFRLEVCNINTPCVKDTVFYKLGSYINTDLLTYINTTLNSKSIQQLFFTEFKKVFESAEDTSIVLLVNITPEILEELKTIIEELDLDGDTTLEELPELQTDKIEEWVNSIL